MALNNTTWTIAPRRLPAAPWLSPVRLAMFSRVEEDHQAERRTGSRRFGLRPLPPRVDFCAWRRGYPFWRWLPSMVDLGWAGCRGGCHTALPQCRPPVPGRRLCLPSRLPRSPALRALRRPRGLGVVDLHFRGLPHRPDLAADAGKRDALGHDGDVADSLSGDDERDRPRDRGADRRDRQAGQPLSRRRTSVRRRRCRCPDRTDPPRP